MANTKNKVSIDNDNFQIILTCAVRYSLGRRTYMPHLVMDYIAPLVPMLSDKTLAVIERLTAGVDIMQRRHAGVARRTEFVQFGNLCNPAVVELS